MTIAVPSPVSDEAEFLAFARDDDTGALERLLHAHLGRAYGHARRRLGPGADADDAVQEACLQLARSARRYDGSVPFAAWLGRLVHTACLRVLRAQRRRRHQEPDMTHPAPTIEDRDPPEAEALRSAVERLPQRYRAVIDLHYFAGQRRPRAGARFRRCPGREPSPQRKSSTDGAALSHGLRLGAWAHADPADRRRRGGRLRGRAR